jgi:hypothetical protein
MAATAGDSPLSSEATAAFRAALAKYETLRDGLAKDSTAGLADAASALAADARKAAQGASGAAKSSLESLAAAADAFKAKPESDIEGLRVAFSDVSKHTVGVLVAAPSLQQGLFVFQCPMVKGYQKWIQTSDGIKNPYMGAKMLECGEKTTWAI